MIFEITILLHVRYLQIKRFFKEDTIGSLIALVLLFFLIEMSYQIYQDKVYAFGYTLSLFVLCLSLQMNRPDKRFIYNNLLRPHAAIYLEYCLLLLPLSVMSLCTKQWFYFPILCSLVLFIPLHKRVLPSSPRLVSISRILPKSNLEWRSGFRKLYLYLLLLYVLALLFSWVRFFSLFPLWLLTSCILSFYNECEPLNVLRAAGDSARKILNQKLASHCLLIILLYIPVLIVNTCFFPEYWLINIIFVVTQCALICFSICYKYTLYRPGTAGVSHLLPIFLSVFSIVPFIWPVPLIMTWRYYFRAKEVINYYVSD